MEERADEEEEEMSDFSSFLSSSLVSSLFSSRLISTHSFYSPLSLSSLQVVTDEIRAIFQQLDDDNSGYIEVHELDDMLMKMGITDEAERKAKVPLEFYK
jgi:Ca2+-binding EF-hand superfamily protein